jgi:hypothetical protein
MMLAGSVIPGNPVRVACDLTATQIAAAAHALSVFRGERYRLAEMSVDDTLNLRELTILVDRFEMLSGHGAHDTVHLTAAQLVQLSDVMRAFMVAQAETDVVHPESRPHLAGAASLVEPLAELARDALKAALDDLPDVEMDDSEFDSLLGP